jgi:hypothetical protein
MKPEIFVSYSREDQAQVFPIVEKLRERGLNIWIDQEGIHGAKLWSQEIVNAIESSKIFILFASAKAFESKNVTKELALASESDKHILPVFIEDAEIPTAMKYQLAGIQHLVHEKGQTNRTADNILRTLGNLDIQYTQLQPTASTTASAASKPDSKKSLLVAAALVIFLAVIAFLLLGGDIMQETASKSTIVEKNKSTIGLCVVTLSEDGVGAKVSKENRYLRDNIISKLTLFRDFNIERGDALSPDANTAEYQALAAKMETDFILQVGFDDQKQIVNAKVFVGRNGNIIWSKSLSEKDIKKDDDFLDKSSAMIASNVAGYAGAIHYEILQKARAKLKRKEKLTAVEYLQLGKASWDDNVDEGNIQNQTGFLLQAIELNPEISTAYAILSEIYLEDLRVEINLIPDALKKAKENSKLAIQLNPQNAMALIERTYITWYEKDYVAFEIQAKDAIEANPYEPYVLATVGMFYTVTGTDDERGKELIEEALSYSQRPQKWYYFGLSEYYLQRKEYEECLKYTVKLEFGDKFYFGRLGAIYWLNNQKQTAIKTFEKAISLDPDYSLKDDISHFSNVWGARRNPALAQAFKELTEAYKNSKQ